MMASIRTLKFGVATMAIAVTACAEPTPDAAPKASPANSETTLAALASSAQPPAPDSSSAQSQTTPSCTLSDPRMVMNSQDPVFGPALSPDASFIAFSGPKHAQVSVLNLDTGLVNKGVSGDGVGWKLFWTGKNSLETRSPWGHRFAMTADGIHRPLPLLVPATLTQSGPAPLVARFYQESDRIWQVTSQGVAQPVTPITHKAFEPLLSPDGAWLVWQDLTTGIWLRHITNGKDLGLGHGAHPVFSHDSRYLLFNRSKDDGLRITESELWIAEVATGTSVALTQTALIHEAWPSLSADDKTVAYTDGLNLWMAQLNCK